MTKSWYYALVLGLGVACAAWFIWLWQQGMEPRAISGARVATPAFSAAATVKATRAVPVILGLPTLLPELRAMLTALARALARGDARDREAVLVFQDDAALRNFAARAADAGLTLLGQLGGLRAVRVRFDSLDALQRDLAAHGSDYANVAANSLVGIPQLPAKQDRADVTQVPFGNEALAFIGAMGDRREWGRGVTIAILDTGVAADPTFGTGRVTALDIGLGLSPGQGSEDGHGTAVAALAGGRSAEAAGVAPAANLLSIRVTDASGTSDLFTVSQAIVAAVDAGATIVNVSLGGYATGPVLDGAIAYATGKGAVIVAAAGNDQAAQLAWPAADARVVSVGAVDKAEQQVSFSNSGAQLQLAAPGYGVQTAWLEGQRVIVDGTSASAPLVAGSIAALLSQNPNLTPSQAVDLLERSANDTGQPGADAAFGRGIVNLATAMNTSNPSYVDTAVSSHFLDADNNQMLFVVQNRSGRTVSGMALNVSVGTGTTTQSVPSLAPGESYVARVPVDDIALRTAGSLAFTTRLTNPLGVVDQVPANNQRSSVLSAPKPQK